MSRAATNSQMPSTGLILPGGGARGAYQVGVLKALTDMLPGSPLPFPVISGISAGAINAGVLASHAEDFPHAVARLEHFWGGLRCEQVYRTGWRHNLTTGLHWLAAMTLGGLGVANPRSLLDNRPLAELLERELDTEKLTANIDRGRLHTLVITASGYATNRAVNFFQADPAVEEWTATRQIGRRAAIDHRHLLASAALPLVFPAQRLGQEYYGDGGLRQTSPLEPSLRLGVDRLLIIGTRDEMPDPEPVEAMDYPSLGEIGGYLLDVIFMDHLTNDLARLQRNNRLIDAMPSAEREATGMRRIDTLLIRPSIDMREIARRHLHRIPASVRALLRGVGIRSDSRMAGYLLFEAEFCRELMELGQADALAARDDILQLLER